MLKLAKEIQEEAARKGFDWEKTEDVFLKLEEELNELKSAYRAKDKERLCEELGDLLFSVVNLSRFLKVDPDYALKRAIEKFRKRFAHIEEELELRGGSMTLAQMDEIWEIIK